MQSEELTPLCVILVTAFNSQGRGYALDQWANSQDEVSISRHQAERSFIAGLTANTGGPVRRAPTSVLGGNLSEYFSHGSLPAFTTGASSTSHDTASVSTSVGGRVIPLRVLNVDESGVAEIEEPEGPVDYECPFDRLGCFKIFRDFDAWYAHSLGHFDGRPPPQKNSCPFCNETFHADTGDQSWLERLRHVESHYRYNNRLSSTGRLDFDLYRYLWKEKVITELGYKELTSRPPSAARQVYMSPSTVFTGGPVTRTERHRFRRPNR